MRRHDNIGYDAFNTYRSGDEASRRSDYGSQESNERGGRSVYARSSRDIDASERNYSSEPGYYGSGNSSRNQSQQHPSNQNRSNTSYNDRYTMPRSQNQSNWSGQHSGERYGNSNSYNTPSNMYRSENRSWQDRGENRADRTGNRMENWADRAEDRMERWDDKIENAWNSWTGDENNRVRQNWRNNPEHYPTYSHGNAGMNRYSENYNNPSSGNRYGSNSDYQNDYRGNRHEDEGFFENIGNKISNVWDRWVGDDSDEERRYQQRSQYGNRSGSNRRDDYDW